MNIDKNKYIVFIYLISFFSTFQIHLKDMDLLLTYYAPIYQITNHKKVVHSSSIKPFGEYLPHFGNILNEKMHLNRSIHIKINPH